MPDDTQHDQTLPPRIALVSTHGYVSANPPLGAADTGGQVVYVLELAKKLAQLGYHVDIWTRRFEDQPEIDVVSDDVRVIRVPCGGKEFIPKEDFIRSVSERLQDVQDNLLERARAFRDANIVRIDTREAFDAFFTPRNPNQPEIHGGFALCHWAGSNEDEEQIQKDLKVTIRCIPFGDEFAEEGTCFYTGKPSNRRVFFAKSY